MTDGSSSHYILVWNRSYQLPVRSSMRTLSIKWASCSTRCPKILRLPISWSRKIQLPSLAQRFLRSSTSLWQYSWLLPSEFSLTAIGSIPWHQVRVENAGMPLVHFALAFKGSSWTDSNSVPLMVIQSLLGSWSRGVVGSCSGYANITAHYELLIAVILYILTLKLRSVVS